jgi:hypothetical protein
MVRKRKAIGGRKFGIVEGAVARVEFPPLRDAPWEHKWGEVGIGVVTVSVVFGCPGRVSLRILAGSIEERYFRGTLRQKRPSKLS